MQERNSLAGEGRELQNPESLGEIRQGAAAHCLPAQDSEPPGEAFGSHIQAGGGGGGGSS